MTPQEQLPAQKEATIALLDRVLVALVAAGEGNLPTLLATKFGRPLPRADSAEVKAKHREYVLWFCGIDTKSATKEGEE